MASKRNQRRRKCTYKKPYRSFTVAQAAARAAMHTSRTRWITPYRCCFCGNWHIGHAPRGTRAAMLNR